MKNSQLEALIIDHEFGELPEEVASLLEAYLATHKDRQKAAVEIRDALGITRKTVNQCPELFRAPVNNGTNVMGPIKVMLAFLKSRNTVVAMALILSGMTGFFLKGVYQPASSTSSPITVENRKQKEPAKIDKSIWASYQIDDGGNPVLLLASTPSQSE